MSDLSIKLTVGLLSSDFLDVDCPLLSVDSNDLAFLALQSSSHDFDCITLADWDGTNVILGPQFLIQMTAHDLSSEA